jgi:hypothetical protein
LQRNGATPARALIGDPRNDENVIISQLHGLFLRFHNRLRRENPDLPFEEIQQLVRHHYQYLILHDFLPRLVKESVLESFKTNKRFDRRELKRYRYRNDPFMPVEFSVAAYRLGHSMVRPGYRLNDQVLLPIFPTEPDLKEGLTGFRAMNSEWGIDWGRFIDVDLRNTTGSGEADKKRLQFAYRIDTSLVNPLSKLPNAVVKDKPPALALRNLLRGLQLGLPSGQAVAARLELEPSEILADEEILLAAGERDNVTPSLASLGIRAFTRNCPLWTYILAEAMHHELELPVPVLQPTKIKTPQLGPVGGRIVAEVFLGLMFGDRNSLLRSNPTWTPNESGVYQLKDFVRYALGT